MAEYRVRYKILPAGTGPDDYEPADLTGGEIVVELTDPKPDNGTVYGPHVDDVKKAVTSAAELKPGDEPVILTWDPA
jgi:hypothetical protein